MEYKIISGRILGVLDTVDGIEIEVHKLISEGWKPLGAPSVVVVFKDYYQFYQAMVKEDY